MKSVIRKVEKADTPKEVGAIVDGHWDQIQADPRAKQPKEMLLYSMETLQEVHSTKRGRESDDEGEKRKRPQTQEASPPVKPKFDTAALLGTLQTMVVEDDVVRRATLRSNGSSDMSNLLHRAFLCHASPDRGDVMKMAQHFGCKSNKRAAASAIVHDPRVLLRLLTELRMHRVRFLCPSRDALAHLLAHSSDIAKHFAAHPDAREFWVEPDANPPPTTTLAWFLGE